MEDYHLVSPHSPGGGGLFLGWKKDINLTFQQSNQKYIDTNISYKGKSSKATFIYGEKVTVRDKQYG